MIPQRVWDKVYKTSDHWVWIGAMGCGGRYGVIYIEGKCLRAHKYLYESLVGEVPEGLVLDHLCGFTGCVNPDHLEPVTQAENVRRYFSNKKPATSCRQGHPYIEFNVYVRPKTGQKLCRECARKRCAKYRLKKKELSHL